MLVKLLSTLALSLLVGVAAGWYGHIFYQDYQEQALIEATEHPPAFPVPAVQMPDLNGRLHNLAGYKGKIMVINVWASWCPPCLREMPEFAQLQQEMAAQGVQFLGIAIDDEVNIRQFLSQTRINYPTLLPGPMSNQIGPALGNDQDLLPYTILVDRNGMVRERHFGYFPKDELRQSIQDLM